MKLLSCRNHNFGLLGICFAVFALISVPLTANAQSAEEKGLQIATESRQNQYGFGNYTANLTMILRNKQGKESSRKVRLKVLEVEGDGDRTLFVFDEPRDVKGTAFLVHAHKFDPDDQWLYLPALKRVKRISSSKQSGSFMGSEFAYEDLGAVEVEKYTYQFLRDEPCGDLQCAVLERVPVSADSGYSRHLVWYDREELRLQQVHYFDRRNAHVKTMTLENYEKYLENYWQSSRIMMVNHLTGKSTDMLWSNLEFKTDLDESSFTQTAIKRVR